MTRNELMALGYKIEWHQYPMAHTVCRELIHEMGEWFHKNPPSSRA
jgi:phospholipase/carboxylesterase